MVESVTDLVEQCCKAAVDQGLLSLNYGTVADYPLLALEQKAIEKPTVYLSSGMHGDEPAGPLAIKELLEEGYFSESDYHWLIVPVLNPVGLSKGTRENGEGWDLNRDYFRFKSVEAKSHAEWLQTQLVPDLMLSLHEDWETSGYYFYEINQSEGNPKASREMMQRLDSVMRREPMSSIDDHEVRELGWIYHEASADEFQSWPEAIYMAERGVPVSLTMETPSSLELRARIDLHKAFVKEAVDLFV